MDELEVKVIRPEDFIFYFCFHKIRGKKGLFVLMLLTFVFWSRILFTFQINEIFRCSKLVGSFSFYWTFLLADFFVKKCSKTSMKIALTRTSMSGIIFKCICHLVILLKNIINRDWKFYNRNYQAKCIDKKLWIRSFFTQKRVDLRQIKFVW